MYEAQRRRGRRWDAGLQHYLRMIGQYSLIDRRREQELARRIRLGDQQALDELVNANLRFVVSVAKRYMHRGLSLMDLVAEGNIGLITAARRFDERRNHRFITYAVWWIRQSIQKALADKTTLVRLPQHRILQVHQLRQLARALEQQRQGRVSEEELAETCGLELDKLRDMRSAVLPPVSLEADPMEQGEEGTTLVENLADEEGDSPEVPYLEQELRGFLTRALSVLNARERLILIRYYGLDQREAWSLEGIGRDLGLSRERVRQLRNQALTRIRKALEDGRVLGGVF
jgi:RNA polymerase primary sigma factor